MKTITAIAILYFSFIAAPSNADTFTVEPPVYSEPGDPIVIQEVFNNDTGEYVGEQVTYDYGNGNTITEITMTDSNE